MGTNYYLTTQACPTCGVSKHNNLHIGKSSMGWTFALHVYPDPFHNINTIMDWVRLFACPTSIITDEYDRLIPGEEMLDIILNRHGEEVTNAGARLYGYHDINHYYERNGAELGPNGLMRRRIDKSHCIGHGSGTYDYCTGDFS